MKLLIAFSVLMGGHYAFGITKGSVNPSALVKPASADQSEQTIFLNQSKQTILSQLSPDEKKSIHIWREEYFQTPKSFQEKFETIGLLINFIVYNKLGNINNLLQLFNQRMITFNVEDSLLESDLNNLEDMENILNFLSQLTNTEILTLNQWAREYQEQEQKSIYRKIYLIMEEVMYGSRSLS